MSETSDTVWDVLSTCSVCQKPLEKDSRPQLLPCCHSSCKDCIEDNKHHLSELVHTNSTEKPEFKCKVCFQEYSPEECIDNYFQRSYWSRNKSNGTQLCQSCEGQNKSAVIQCKDKDCGWICEDCHLLHKTHKIFKEHQLDETTKISPPESVITNLCPLHNEELTVYCKTCRSPYCCRCILKDHNLHVYEDTKDTNQLNNFYNNFKKKVESINEKRSFAENTLQKFETIETDISGQKAQCIEKIKSIVNKLQEKVSELGTTLLDKVNNVCQQKEQEFNQKKNQLRQMNAAFKFTEEFVSAILALNEPMDVMKAQDLLNIQLEKLLNKPCSHPDFITPFKIEVIDALTDKQNDSQGFDVSRMIDGVLNMCFKIVTTDDRKEQVINPNPVSNGDDEISIIGMSRSTTPSTRPNVQTIQSVNQQQARAAAKANTFRAAATAVSSGTRTVVPTIIGNSNRELSRILSNSNQSTHFANQLQYPVFTPNSLSVPPQRSRIPPQSQAPTASANSMQTSHNMPQNNLMPQTGILSGQSYGSPQVYRGAVINQSAQNQTVSSISIPTTLYNYANQQTVAPNVTLRSNQQMAHSFRLSGSQPYITFSKTPTSAYGGTNVIQTSVQSGGTTHPTVVYASAPNPQDSTIIAQLTQSTNTILSKKLNERQQQKQHPQQQQQQQQQQLQKQQQLTNEARNERYELLKQREIHRIEQELRGSQPAFPNDPQFAQRVIDMIENTTTDVNSNFQTNNANNSCAIATNSNASTPQSIPTVSSGQSLPIADQTARVLHLPEITSIVQSQEPERRVSQESVTSSNASPQSNQSPPLTTQSSVPNTSSSAPQTTSPDSTQKTAMLSMPSIEQITGVSAEKPSETTTNKELNSDQSENVLPMTPPAPEEEVILPHLESNPPSINSLFSELSNGPFPEISDSPVNNSENNNNTENKSEENRENTTVTRPTAPVARIAPITNETDNSNHEIPEVVEISDDLTDDEAIDEDADCVVCSKEYGEFICCAQCPRAFHCECHVPELKKMPETSFICTFCKSLDDVVLSSRVRKTGLNDRQQRVCEKLLLHLFCNKKSHDFKPPASDVIQNSLNLNSIKKKLENKEFENERQFLDEIRKLFANYKNRNITPDVSEEYNTFERYFKKIVHKLMPSFSEVLQNNISINNFDPSSGSTSKRTKSNCVSI